MALRLVLICALGALVVADKTVHQPTGPQLHNFIGAGGFDSFGGSVAPLHAYHGASFDKGPIQAVGGHASLGSYGLGSYGAQPGYGYHGQPQIIYVRPRGRKRNRGKGGNKGGNKGGSKGGKGGDSYDYDYGYQGHDHGYDQGYGYDYDDYSDDKGKGGGFMKGLEKGLKEMGKLFKGGDDYDDYEDYAPPPKVVQAPPISAVSYGKGYASTYGQPGLATLGGAYGNALSSYGGGLHTGGQVLSGGYGLGGAHGGYGLGGGQVLSGGYGLGGGYGKGQILAGQPQLVVPLNAHHQDDGYDYDDYYEDEGYMSKAFKSGMNKMKNELDKAYKGMKNMFSKGEDYEDDHHDDPILVVNSPVYMKNAQFKGHGPIPGYGLPGSFGVASSYGGSYGHGFGHDLTAGVHGLGVGGHDLKGATVLSSGLKAGSLLGAGHATVGTHGTGGFASSYSLAAPTVKAAPLIHSAPSVQFAKSSVSHAAPAVSYGAPAVSHSVPAATYGAPSTTHSVSHGVSHDKGFSSPVVSHSVHGNAGLSHVETKGGLVSSYSSH